MKIAIFSDIHDNIWNLERALKDLARHGPGVLFFLGDFCAPFTLSQLAEGFPGPIHAVFGNNDGDTFLLSAIAAQHPHVTLHGQMAEVTVEEELFALNHYPDIARRLAESRRYTAVFSGHDHRRYVEEIGRTLWANPGEIMGRFGEPSYGIYDVAAHDFTHIDI